MEKRTTPAQHTDFWKKRSFTRRQGSAKQALQNERSICLYYIRPFDQSLLTCATIRSFQQQQQHRFDRVETYGCSKRISFSSPSKEKNKMYVVFRAGNGSKNTANEQPMKQFLVQRCKIFLGYVCCNPAGSL